MGKQQRGFTLVELVFVIVILGILAAFAIPRYVDLTEEARIASLEGVQGTVRAAAALVKAQAIAEEKDAAASSSINVEGSTVLTVFGYPATAAIDEALADPTAGGKVTFAAGTFRHSAAPDSANCSFSYTQPAAAGNPPTVSALTTTGC